MLKFGAMKKSNKVLFTADFRSLQRNTMPVKDDLVFFYISIVNNVVELERSTIKLNDGFQI